MTAALGEEARGVVEARAGVVVVAFVPPPGVAAAGVAAASVGAELGPSAWDDGDRTSPDGCTFIARLATSMLGVSARDGWVVTTLATYYSYMLAADASGGLEEVCARAWAKTKIVGAWAKLTASADHDHCEERVCPHWGRERAGNHEEAKTE